jgi:hypothetical protein
MEFIHRMGIVMIAFCYLAKKIQKGKKSCYFPGKSRNLKALQRKQNLIYSHVPLNDILVNVTPHTYGGSLGVS